MRSSRSANFVLQIFDFVLESFVLLVGFGAEHLIPQLRDLLLVHLDIAFELLAVFLIGGEGGAVGFQAPLVGFQRLFDNGDMFGKRGDFFFELRHSQVDGLELTHQTRIRVHENLY